MYYASLGRVKKDRNKTRRGVRSRDDYDFRIGGGTNIVDTPIDSSPLPSTPSTTQFISPKLKKCPPPSEPMIPYVISRSAHGFARWVLFLLSLPEYNNPRGSDLDSDFSNLPSSFANRVLFGMLYFKPFDYLPVYDSGGIRYYLELDKVYVNYSGTTRFVDVRETVLREIYYSALRQQPIPASVKPLIKEAFSDLLDERQTDVGFFSVLYFYAKTAYDQKKLIAPKKNKKLLKLARAKDLKCACKAKGISLDLLDVIQFEWLVLGKAPKLATSCGLSGLGAEPGILGLGLFQPSASGVNPAALLAGGLLLYLVMKQ